MRAETTAGERSDESRANESECIGCADSNEWLSSNGLDPPRAIIIMHSREYEERPWRFVRAGDTRRRGSSDASEKKTRNNRQRNTTYRSVIT